jgi:hypothetical protein
MKTRLQFFLVIFFVLNLPYSYCQKNPVSFEFNWTSGDLIEVVAKSTKSGTIMVQFSDFPQDFKTNNMNDVVDEMKITSSRELNPSDKITLLVVYETADNGYAVLGIADNSISIKPSQINLILDKINNCSPPLDEEFYIFAMKKNNLYKLKIDAGVSINDSSFQKIDSASVLKVIRYRYKNRFLTYLEKKESTKIIDVFSDNLIRLDSLKRKNQRVISDMLPDISAVETVRITILDSVRSTGCLKIEGKLGNEWFSEFSDTITVKSIFPSKYRSIKIIYANPKYRANDTPWDPMQVSNNGESNFVLLKDFNLIENGGRIKVNYYWPEEKEIYQITSIVLERYFLGIEMGSVFNVNEEGKPVGKFEYSLIGTSVLGDLVGIWDASAGVRFTSMRFPQDQEQNPLQIGDIVESKLQIGWSPWQEQWEANKFSFIGNIFSKTNNLKDSSDIKFYPGIGLGCRISVPSFNEKRPKEEYGRSTGSLSLYLAWDYFWRPYDWFRLVSEFRIDVFKIASNAIIFSLSGKLDGPIGLKGPTDLRFSVLSTVNVSTISGLLSSK